MKRKFLYFSDEELTVLVDALEQCGEKVLLQQASKEIEIREQNRKLVESIKSHQPRDYAC